MKAIVYKHFGSSDILECREVEKPVPGHDEVLIKVRAASINPLDWKLMKGGPFIMRLLLGLGKAKLKRPGVDVAGEVEAAGKNVTQFKPGDPVFGTCYGAFAEYATSKSVTGMKSALVVKPDNVTFEQAASAPVAALTPKGIFVGVGAPPDLRLSQLLAGTIGALVQSLFVSQKVTVFMARVNEQDLTTLGELMATAKVTPVIDRRYRLSEARDAFLYMEEGHARGKVVITPED